LRSDCLPFRPSAACRTLARAAHSIRCQPLPQR